MAEEKEQEKKIIIDEGWKQQAKKEKEVLAAQEEIEEKEKAQQEKTAPRGPLPKGDLAALISMLVTQAFFALGVLKVEGQEKEPDLELGKYNIDMLETLQEKTKGNLSQEEEKVLSNTISQVRMAYVKVAG